MITLKSKTHSREFEEIIKFFPEKLSSLKDKEKINLKEFLQPKTGIKKIAKKLHLNSLIDSPTDFPGIYAFYKNDLPFYVGISGSVLRRINQHLKGNDHNNSSLCFTIGSELHYSKHGIKIRGRKNLDFNEYCIPAKVALSDCDFNFLKMENDLELSLFEIYAAISLGTLHYNKFKTH